MFEPSKSPSMDPTGDCYACSSSYTVHDSLSSSCPNKRPRPPSPSSSPAFTDRVFVLRRGHFSRPNRSDSRCLETDSPCQTFTAAAFASTSSSPAILSATAGCERRLQCILVHISDGGSQGETLAVTVVSGFGDGSPKMGILCVSGQSGFDCCCWWCSFSHTFLSRTATDFDLCASQMNSTPVPRTQTPPDLTIISSPGWWSSVYFH